MLRITERPHQTKCMESKRGLSVSFILGRRRQHRFSLTDNRRKPIKYKVNYNYVLKDPYRNVVA